VIGDGHLGIWGALAAVFPEAKEQRCWNHRLLNVLDKLPLKQQAEARSLLTKIPYAETREEAEQQKRAFQTWCTKRGHAEVGRALDRDWERMVTFYQFPRPHWKHLRTSNPVESPFAAVRLRTAAAQRFKKVDNATAVIWKTLLIAEKTFRRLDAPELLADVASDAVYVNGVRAVNPGRPGKCSDVGSRRRGVGPCSGSSPRSTPPRIRGAIARCRLRDHREGEGTAARPCLPVAHLHTTALL
jgi:putative transposase